MGTPCKGNTMKNAPARAFRLCCTLMPIGLLAAAIPALGDTTTTSSLGFSEPQLLKVGRPAGSYAMSDFDTVNLFNGNLSIHLPLLVVYGRGTAGYTMTLPVYQRWRIDRITDGSSEWRSAIPDSQNYQFGTTDRAAYGAGTLTAKAIGLGGAGTIQNCNSGPRTGADKSQVRLTFTSADGSTVELFDKKQRRRTAADSLVRHPGAIGASLCSQGWVRYRVHGRRRGGWYMGAGHGREIRGRLPDLQGRYALSVRRLQCHLNYARYRPPCGLFEA